MWRYAFPCMASSIIFSRSWSSKIRHRRPSSAKRGADSFQVWGISTGGRSSAGCGVEQPARRARLIAVMRRMVRRGDALVQHVARLFGLVLDVGGGALLRQVPVGE